METAAQISFIVLYLLSAGAGFAIIGKTPTGENRYSGTALSAVVYGLLTIPIVMTWETPDIWSLVAKVAVLVLMWGPFLIGLVEIDQPYTEQSKKAAVIHAASCAVSLALVVTFWL